MIPKNDNLTSDIRIIEIPSKTYKMDLNGDVIHGYTDGLEAMRQAIYKIIRTERYKYIIYSFNYGIELIDLIGEPISFAIPEIERRITEALLSDDRILAVNNFEFELPKKGVVFVRFIAETTQGDISIDTEVNI